MNYVVNTLLILAAIIFAVYIAPFLIALIASGIIQLLITIAVIYCVIRLALNNDRSDADRYH